eukprot:jgi/Mesen1/1113/ME000123S00282
MEGEEGEGDAQRGESLHIEGGDAGEAAAQVSKKRARGRARGNEDGRAEEGGERDEAEEEKEEELEEEEEEEDEEGEHDMWQALQRGGRWVQATMVAPTVEHVRSWSKRLRRGDEGELGKEAARARLLDGSAAAALRHFARLDREHEKFLAEFRRRQVEQKLSELLESSRGGGSSFPASADEASGGANGVGGAGGDAGAGPERSARLGPGGDSLFSSSPSSMSPLQSLPRSRSSGSSFSSFSRQSSGAAGSFRDDSAGGGGGGPAQGGYWDLKEAPSGVQSGKNSAGAGQLDAAGPEKGPPRLSRAASGKGAARSKSRKSKGPPKMPPVEVDRVTVKGGTLLLVGWGDSEPRMLEHVNCTIQLSKNYRCVSLEGSGRPREWRAGAIDAEGGRLRVKLRSDLDEKKWDVSIHGKNLFAPIMERLFEIPIDWHSGRADGQHTSAPARLASCRLHHLTSLPAVRLLSTPMSRLQNVNGALAFEGQRMFFHDAKGSYGAVPLGVSGDMDLNPIGGEYRISAQVAGVELNSLMKTLGAKPTPLPLAGALKGAVVCRGPLDIPTFEGTAEFSRAHVGLALATKPSDATRAIALELNRKAAAAYDKIPFTSGSGSFSFNSDNCMAELYGVRLVPVGGGEIRGAGNMWVSPEGEVEPGSVEVDCWAHDLPADSLLRYYLPAGMELPAGSIGSTHGEAKVRGALLTPTIEAKWKAPESTGSFEGAQGGVAISKEAISVTSSAASFDIDGSIMTSFPPLPPRERSSKERLRSLEAAWENPSPPKPALTGVNMDLRLKSFDFMGFVPADRPPPPVSPTAQHFKVTAKVKLSGEVPKLPDLPAGNVMDSLLSFAPLPTASASAAAVGAGGPLPPAVRQATSGGFPAHEGQQLSPAIHGETYGGLLPPPLSPSPSSKGLNSSSLGLPVDAFAAQLAAHAGGRPAAAAPVGAQAEPAAARQQQEQAPLFLGLVGDIAIQGLKVNQLVVGSNLSGVFDVSPSGFDLHTTGRSADEHLHVEVSSGSTAAARRPGGGGLAALDPASFSGGLNLALQRGQMKAHVQYQPGMHVKLEVKNLQLDELEVASLRGRVDHVDVALNLHKRRGAGSLAVRKPRFSGLQSESLDANFRWTGDVITLEKSVLEQTVSRYELQGEYVLPGPRERAAAPGSRENFLQEEEEGLLGKAMAGQLKKLMTTMGRWRMRLEVPHADVAELLPAARLLARSRDPAVVFRSKELFVNGVQNAGFCAQSLMEQLEYIRERQGTPPSHGSEEGGAAGEEESEAAPLPGLAELKGRWHGADFNLSGQEWEWGAYKVQTLSATGDYSNEGLRLEQLLIQKDTATMHADGTLLGPNPNLHFAVLNFPANLVPPLLQVVQSSSPEALPSPPTRPPQANIKGVLHAEGDWKGTLSKPQCEMQVRLLDGAVGGVSLGRAEVAAAVTPSSRVAFHAFLEPSTHTGHVRVQGSVPWTFSDGAAGDEEDTAEEVKPGRARGDAKSPEADRDRDAWGEKEGREKDAWDRDRDSREEFKEREKDAKEKDGREREWDRDGARDWDRDRDSAKEGARDGSRVDLGKEKARGAAAEGEEGAGEKREEPPAAPPRQDSILSSSLVDSLRTLDRPDLAKDAMEINTDIKDGGMMLLTAVSPGIRWLQGYADVAVQVRGTLEAPEANGVATFNRVSISSPVLPRPLSNLGGTIRVTNSQLVVEELEGRVGRRGVLQVKGRLPLQQGDGQAAAEGIEIKADALEVRARNVFSGQVDSQLRFMGSLLEPEVTGGIKLSRGIAYLSQEKAGTAPPSALPPRPAKASMEGSYNWMAAANKLRRSSAEALSLPQLGFLSTAPEEDEEEGAASAAGAAAPAEGPKLPVALRLRGLKLLLGPELRLMYPLILNFAAAGELELNGYAEASQVKPRGTLAFENGEVNLVATQVRLNRDHPNRAKFDSEQGLDPILDLKLVGADWQLKIQGPASTWQAARVFESQLAGSLLEEDGQLAFKRLAAATVETLMPKIETKGEFGQARWRLVSAPQIPNLLSLDPTTDPFKSLANLSFGTEVELQIGKNIQASVVRQLKESEMATQWTLLYQLNSKLRLLFSSISSVDNRLLFEYSATSQN